MSAYLLVFLLFFLQFFYLPFGTSFFEGAKVYAVEVVVLLLLLLQLFSKEGIAFKNYKKHLLLCVGVLLLITIYHSFFHQSATLFFGNAFRLQGTFLLWMLLLFTLLSSRISIEKYIKPIGVSLVIFVQLVCALLFIGVGADRPIGTMGEPNALAADVLFLWPFLAFAWPKKLPLRILSLVGLVCAFLILFVSGSRSGFIALIVQGSFLLGIKVFPKRQMIALILAFAVLAISLALPFFAHRNEYEDRGEIWTAAVVAASANPILGVGFGNAEYSLHSANVKLHNHLPGYYVDSAHNIFLDWFIQAGFVGLAVFIFLLYQTFQTFLRKQQTRNLVLLLGLLTALSFNPASVVSLIGLWWLIGQGNSSG